MTATDDIALLREYASGNSEAAFETLVSRHARFVYSAALRQVRDPHLAEEVTQAVFIILAKKAARIGGQTVLSGWLFRTTRYTAMAQMRTVARRRQHEQEALMEAENSANTPDPVWEQISPLLDPALATLREKDRQAVLLRFFEQRSLAEVGSSLNATEDTARMRINRALEKLRKYFSRHGVVSTTAIIAGMLSANSLQAAPVGLTATITATVAKGSAAAASILTLVKGTLNIMAWIKTKMVVGIGAGALLAGAAVVTLAQQEQKVRAQEQEIRAQENQIREQEKRTDLTAEQRKELADQLNQLREKQNELRTKQNQLRASSERANSKLLEDKSLRVSPFTGVVFEGDKVLVTYEGAQYELAMISGLTTPQLVDFSRTQYKDLWQKRIAEDLPVVLAESRHPMNSDHTVSLTLMDATTGQSRSIARATMTEKNRQAIMAVRLAGARPDAH